MQPKEQKEPQFDFNELFTEPDESSLKDLLPWASIGLSFITMIVVLVK